MGFVDGRVVAVGRSFYLKGKRPEFFSIMLPESSLHTGHDHVELLEVGRGGTGGVSSSSTPSTSAEMSMPCQCTNSGVSVSLITSTATGLPSRIRKTGPGAVPL